MPDYYYRPVLFFVDWDSTLTTESTMELMASIKSYPNIHPRYADLAEVSTFQDSMSLLT